VKLRREVPGAGGGYVHRDAINEDLPMTLREQPNLAVVELGAEVTALGVQLKQMSVICDI